MEIISIPQGVETMADIKHAIAIDAPAERVRSLAASAAGLSQWWAADSTELGTGVAELGFFKKSTLYRLRLETQSPDEILWRCETGDEWNGTRLRFTVRQNGATTDLRFAHEGWAGETEYFTHCNTTWGELMYRLKATAEGKSPGPLFLTESLAY
jgi:uncharacterized protein YndB with AHSA1/START domain